MDARIDFRQDGKYIVIEAGGNKTEIKLGHVNIIKSDLTIPQNIKDAVDQYIPQNTSDDSYDDSDTSFEDYDESFDSYDDESEDEDESED